MQSWFANQFNDLFFLIDTYYILRYVFDEVQCYSCTSVYRGKTQAAKDIAGRFPLTHYWDAQDSKLIVCEAKILIDAFNKKEKEEKKIVSLSKTMDDGPVSFMWGF